MIRVIVGTSTTRNEKNYTASTTIREILDDNAVDYSAAQVMLDGVSIKLGDMDKKLADLNITDKCMLTAIVKAANA